MSLQPNPHPKLLAKSRENGGTTLYDHLLHVAAAAEAFARYAGMDVPTARLGALLHDIGKARAYGQLGHRNQSRVAASNQKPRNELLVLS